MSITARKVERLGLISARGWQIKSYGIVEQGGFFAAHFETGLALACAELPDPIDTCVGFAILHLARVADYLALCRWDNRNELPIWLYVRTPGQDWRPADAREGLCVWDLALVAHERDAFVRTILSGGDAEAYLADLYPFDRIS